MRRLRAALLAVAVVALLALLLSLNGRSALGASFVVNLSTDVSVEDAHPGDGVCDADDGTAGNQCGLRTAIGEADALSGADSITFDPGVVLITLADNLPTITDASGLTINGGGSVTISGDNTHAIFLTGSSSAALTLQGLTLTNAKDGAVINNGDLHINDSHVINSNNSSDGGAIVNFDSGIATISGTTVSGNSALTGAGGGIYNEGMLTVTNSQVTGNDASTNGGGIANAAAGTLVLNNSTVSSNNAGSTGGGISNQDGSVTLNDTDVTQNMASFGAGIHNDNLSTLQIKQGSHVNGNTASGNAGGIANLGTLTVTDSSVNSNQGGFGAGINTAGNVTLTNSTVNQNIAGHSGGGFEFAHGTLSITNSQVSNNTAADQGGAIDSFDGGGTITITESTLAGNSATSAGGAIYSIVAGTMLTIDRSTLNDNTATAGGGGAIRSDSGTVTLVNSTISHNSAQYGGGIYSGDDNTSNLTNVTVTANLASALGGGIYAPSDVTTTVNLRNTIVADQNTNTDCDGLGFHSLGNNLDSDNKCNLTQPSDRPQVDVFLAPLADNGGPTKTHALMPASNAIDGGDDSVCSASPVGGVDQRGVHRPSGPHCDIGAYELVQATPTPTPTPLPTSTPVPETEVWGDNDCSGVIDANDSTRGILAVAIPSAVEAIDGCPAMGQTLQLVDVHPAGAGVLSWGDVDCDQSLTGRDPLFVLRHVAGLPALSQPVFCPDVGDSVVFTR